MDIDIYYMPLWTIIERVLNHRTKYLQIAMNSSLAEARAIIRQLPKSDRILVEAGTPVIKNYGIAGIKEIKQFWSGYVVADLKTIDRADTEVQLAKLGGADAAIASGHAPLETINQFIKACKAENLDSMIDMMNVEQPVQILRKIKLMPSVVILHRGVDEETFNKQKPIPFAQINKVKSSFNTMISIGGGDTIREVQRATFNGADIVLVWKEFYQATDQTAQLAQEILEATK
jgi:bifunctional enzyme Fae/Hps